MRAVVETLLEILEKADISSTVFSEPITNPEKFDLGLRALLVSGENEPYEPVLNRLRRLEQNTFYHLQDTFYTNYAIFLLPDEERPRWLSVGPMLITQPSGEQILSLLERLGLPGTLYHGLAAYYERLPQLKSQEVFDTICLSLADAVFSGRSQYQIKIIHNSAEPDALQQIIARSDPLQEESIELKLERLKTRYELENAFIKAAASGDANATLSAYYRFVRFASELVRIQDRLRDKKDLTVTLNTLLRKAAETAGVHPYYIDAFSNASIVRLEQCGNSVQLDGFCRELIIGYCELVQQYALSPYSQPVQSAISLIQADLNADLSLAAMAEKLNLTRSYLSNLFCREVGQPLSEYVLEKRIQRARHLLTTTPLSVQDIAWEVGISDANYFTRLFKRETGVTPRKYRETGQA